MSKIKKLRTEQFFIDLKKRFRQKTDEENRRIKEIISGVNRKPKGQR